MLLSTVPLSPAQCGKTGHFKTPKTFTATFVHFSDNFLILVILLSLLPPSLTENKSVVFCSKERKAFYVCTPIWRESWPKRQNWPMNLRLSRRQPALTQWQLKKKLLSKKLTFSKIFLKLFKRNNTIDVDHFRYKEKFGFPFVICARQNKKDAILKGIQHRLNNSADQELKTGIEEVEKICLLRLQNIVKSL